MKKGNECENEEKTKIYEIRRKNQKNAENNLVRLDNKINVFVLFHENDKKVVLEVETKFSAKNIDFVNGIGHVNVNLKGKNNVLQYFDCILVVVSSECLKDYSLMEILAANYKDKGKNKKVIPVIIEDEIYEPEKQAELDAYWEKRINNYKTYFKGDFGGKEAKTIEKMQAICAMLSSFLDFSTQKDQKSDLELFQRVKKQIEENKKGIIEDRREVRMECYYNQCQINQASENGTVIATQNNENGAEKDLNSIIKTVEIELESMKEEEAENIKDMLNMLREEMKASKPRKGRLKNCLQLLVATMSTINNAPQLLENLQKIKEYIERYL